MTGTLGVTHIAGSWSARKVFGEVWKAAVEMNILNDPRIIQTLTINDIRATIPLAGNGAVQSQLQEFEHAEVQNADPFGYDITLLKDRFRIGVSDESQMASDVGDPMVIQKTQAAAEMAGNLEQLIATQIWTTPQILGGVGFNWAAQSPLVALGTAIQTLRPYRATAVVMGTNAFADYVSALGTQVFTGAQTPDMERGITYVPGYGIPVFSSVAAEDVSANGFAVISTQAPGLVLGMGGVKIREWDDPDKGSKFYQYDIWRTPFSNLRQTAANTNRGVITGVTL